jgi:ribonuclease VapC
VLDASALLAVFHAEPGSELIEPLIAGSFISAVNWSEVVQKSMAAGAETVGLRSDVTALEATIVSFDASQAEIAASLWERALRKGLSLADRACLALAVETGLPAVTTDRAWQEVEVGVEIFVVR